MYLTGATITFIIHIFFDFVKLMYKFFENSYENTEKNRVCQSLLQLVNVPMRYLYWRCCIKISLGATEKPCMKSLGIG